MNTAWHMHTTEVTQLKSQEIISQCVGQANMFNMSTVLLELPNTKIAVHQIADSQ